MNHYTYNIINKTNGKYYIGLRSTEIEPKNDIGVEYFGSSENKELKQALKEDKSNFLYKVIETYDSREDAYKGEERIHQKINVSKDPASYNLINSGHPDRHGIPNSEETRQKISNTLKEYYKNNEHHQKGIPISDEHKEKLRQAMLGRKHTWGDKIGKAQLGRKEEVKTCPKCGISGGVSQMTRYHFDNCTGVISGKQAHRHGLPGGEWYNRMSVEAKKRYMKKHKIGSKLRENFGV